jgi:chromosome segregation ATPase
MIEPIMYVAIGFLGACMLIIGIIPVVHARAVRLTTRRLEAVTPMSMAEIQADKDQLRAEFAMSTRRLEMSVEQMKSKTTGQLAEIGKKSEAIGRLKLELGEKTALILALEAKERQLTEELQATQQQRDEKINALQETERRLGETRAELAAVTTNRNEASLTVDSQRVELVTLRAQVEVLKGQIDSYDSETRDLRERLTGETSQLGTTRQQLTDELARSEALTTRVTELEREVIAQTTEAEILGRRVQELLARLDEQSRFLAEREYASETLRNEGATAQKTIEDLRAELVEAENRRRSHSETLQRERSALENQLRQSQEERARLQDEIVTMKREVETTWANERTENAVLRERINDVAAEVARLTSVLEGPGSTIESMIASESAPSAPLVPVAANGNQVPGNSESPKGSLADRIRALQSRASQAPQPSRV